MRFRAVQQKGQGDDDRKRIERCITFALSVDNDFLLTCNSLIGMQVGRFNNCLKPIIEFSLRHTEEPHKFSLRHGNLAFTLADNLHIIAPIKDNAMIVRAFFAL